MNYLQRFMEQVRVVLFVTLLVDNLLLLGVWYAITHWWHFSESQGLLAMLAAGVFFNLILERVVSKVIMEPLELLWRAILHISPNHHGGSLEPKRALGLLGKDLVEALTGQLYNLVMVTNAVDSTSNTAPDLHKNFIANSLPLPLIVLDREQTIIFANKPALDYIGATESDFTGKNLHHRLNMTFVQGDQDFDGWLKEAQATSVTAVHTWNRVKTRGAEADQWKQFDLTAFYNKDNPDNCETMLVMFDHTAEYSQNDTEVDFVALAVHELRTPVTVLRGYVEALDEEIGASLSGEVKDYFNKMKASSQQLTSFINNILNVARVDGNQLTVELREENWNEVVTAAVESIRLRAEVRGLTIECDIPATLPTVGVDRFSISEVITNLIDNAIKYSGGKTGRIIVRARAGEGGMVETTVRDYGVGIAESVIPTLFNKFQRNFHNRATVVGTGIGLYLSKTIVNLHGGNIWVNSKEGKGTIIGFTVPVYSSLSDEQKTRQASGIIQGRHGWIKNHSMSRR